MSTINFACVRLSFFFLSLWNSHCLSRVLLSFFVPSLNNWNYMKLNGFLSFFLSLFLILSSVLNFKLRTYLLTIECWSFFFCKQQSIYSLCFLFHLVYVDRVILCVVNKVQVFHSVCVCVFPPDFKYNKFYLAMSWLHICVYVRKYYVFDVCW